jgi:hypothetical protein
VNLGHAIQNIAEDEKSRKIKIIQSKTGNEPFETEVFNVGSAES